MGVLQYHIISRPHKYDKTKPAKTVYTAKPVNHGKISFDEFCAELADGSTVDKADVKAVLSRIAVVVPRLVERGYSVDAGDLGTFRASFGSKLVEHEKDFKVDLISKPRVVFTPRVAFKNSLRSVSFERVRKEGKVFKPVGGSSGASGGSGSGASGGDTSGPVTGGGSGGLL